MSIKLNHTIVPAKDKEAAAKLFAQIFGLNYDGPMGHFAPVRVNDELTMDFDNADSFEPHHYAFHVSDNEFDAIFQRIQEAGIDLGQRASKFAEPATEFPKGRARRLLSRSRRSPAGTAHAPVNSRFLAKPCAGVIVRFGSIARLRLSGWSTSSAAKA